jgi:hypothetical protein
MACNKSQFKDLTPDTVHMFFEAVQDNVAVNMLAVLDLGDCIKVAMSAGQGGTDGLVPKADVEGLQALVSGCEGVAPASTSAQHLP